MVTKQIITTLIILISFGISIVYSAECNSDFYLYNFKYTNGEVQYTGRTLENGCMPGNTQAEMYKLNLIKNDQVQYSYGFNPNVRFTDGITKNNEITGGAQMVKETLFSLPVPVTDYDRISVLDENGKEISSLTKTTIENKEKQENNASFSFVDWVNNLMSSLMNKFFR